jgi:tetratricopeptide (TPR) repeat protein
VIERVLAASNEVSSATEAFRKARELARHYNKASGISELQAVLTAAKQALASGAYEDLGFPAGATSEQITIRLLRLFQLLFFLGVEIKWGHGAREAGLSGMHVLIDRLQNFEEAIDWGNEIIQSSPDPEFRQIVLADVGIALIHTGNIIEAIKCISAALELANLRGDQYYVAKYQGDLGAAYARVGNFILAGRCYELALEAADNLSAFEFRDKFVSDLATIRRAIKEERGSETKH